MAPIEALRDRHLDGLAREVCTSRGVLLREVLGASRSRSVVRARHELWWRIRHLPDRCYSSPEIGRLFGRDHSTILAGIEAHAARTRPP